MVAKGDLKEFAAGKRGWIGCIALQAGEDLGADALDIGAFEMRRRQRHPKQIEGLVPVILQHAHRAAEIIPRHAETQLDGAAVEALMKGLGIEVTRAFIDETGDHIADAGFVGRVLCSATADRKFHRHQRHRSVLHEPGLDASG